MNDAGYRAKIDALTLENSQLRSMLVQARAVINQLQTDLLKGLPAIKEQLSKLELENTKTNENVLASIPVETKVN